MRRLKEERFDAEQLRIVEIVDGSKDMAKWTLVCENRDPEWKFREDELSCASLLTMPAAKATG